MLLVVFYYNNTVDFIYKLIADLLSQVMVFTAGMNERIMGGGRIVAVKRLHQSIVPRFQTHNQ